MKFKWKLMALLAVLLVALAACNGNNNNTGKNDTNTEPTRYNTDRNNTRGDMDGYTNQENDRFRNNDRINDENYTRGDNDNNNNSRYRVAKESADRITDRIPQIKRAYVLTTDNNAYVAAQLDTNYNNGVNDDNNNDVNNNNGINGNNTATNNNNKNGLGNAADTGHELTNDVKKKIKDIVQDVDADIDNVYVSTNPDFYNLANNYVTDTNNGKPVRGMFDQLGNMIQRIFPQNR
ncbi:YhcN/YlaJ family sporulation lipoprotein [Virgibacillus sp. 179-BFC.A HS]|uniref:YhcN/YlaJ family sporulation lipoprotein n=1 Tax=Tigheibacillus jepli TaxID=3035914 RepID=A0ABU5CJ74_9BACI|nr:YhcN/YlaJ family sporulation lipoprotein [Virgibacillus sp. 179-BFC.A HS]MDY0406280.1 YhcN/YlaJ family sporulation lipoprotein [Virgibacillus sp. 179-BFC.A HS]